ncbi:serine hydrolase domain-containing protein [Microbacterium aoyamense]|uniref:Serine hydrolase domain-containing protein n=1 Tax=Microbacterium aoyamense TaxID=344166 RepID=A0ABN2PJV9_9MICO|nr:serine hydrolase domain-containing protein [Microbacterium aoyamense]
MNQPAPVQIIDVSGFARAPFEPIVEAFTRAVAAQGGGGAALAIRHDGELVVDLVAGDYRVDSLQLLYSVSKAVTATAAAMLAEAGELDLDAPLAQWWPEMAKSSTSSITPRMVLSHTSGLASLDRELTYAQLLAHEDDEAIGAQEPYWEPGTALGYHAFTFGTVMNGLFRRALGTSVGEVVEQRIARPHGLDLWIGTPDSVFDRIERISSGPRAVSASRAAFGAASDIPPSSTARLDPALDIYNRTSTYAAEMPSLTAVGDARSLAAFFAATLDGTLLSESARDEMVRPRAIGPDLVLGMPMHYGSGMQLPFPQLPLLGPRSYGHEGAGGSVAFADAEFDLSVAWTTDVYPSMAGASPAFIALLPTIRHCLTTDTRGEPKR